MTTNYMSLDLDNTLAKMLEDIKSMKARIAFLETELKKTNNRVASEGFSNAMRDYTGR